MPRNPDPAPAAPPGTFRVAEVARIWTEERRRNTPGAPEVKPSTVWSYLKESLPLVGTRPGRYANNPMPAPDGYMGANKHGPWWKVGREQELRDWWNSRPGLSHGTGAQRRGSTRLRRERP